jgi:hypothetical protein
MIIRISEAASGNYSGKKKTAAVDYSYSEQPPQAIICR